MKVDIVIVNYCGLLCVLSLGAAVHAVVQLRCGRSPRAMCSNEGRCYRHGTLDVINSTSTTVFV